PHPPTPELAPPGLGHQSWLPGSGVQSFSLAISARVLAGGLQAWIDAGLPVQSSPDIPPDEACVDYLFFVHDRHSGNKAAARQYLEWEVNLISQLDERELGEFRLPRR
ncbi:hypothetical protein WLW63_07890, partial [Bordetella bronchiseptica]